VQLLQLIFQMDFSILLVVHEGISNETANQSLLSEFQLRVIAVKTDSTCHRHGGIQQLVN
jgi:hypothetical protein